MADLLSFGSQTNFWWTQKLTSAKYGPWNVLLEKKIVNLAFITNIILSNSSDGFHELKLNFATLMQRRESGIVDFFEAWSGSIFFFMLVKSGSSQSYYTQICNSAINTSYYWPLAAITTELTCRYWVYYMFNTICKH